MATVTHPTCGKTFPTGTQAGHCGVCCETFIGLISFEAHRVGEHGTPERRCEIQAYDGPLTSKGKPTFGHWSDDRGYWHHGRKLTAEEKAELWPTKDDEAA